MPRAHLGQIKSGHLFASAAGFLSTQTHTAPRLPSDYFLAPGVRVSAAEANNEAVTCEIGHRFECAAAHCLRATAKICALCLPWCVSGLTLLCVRGISAVEIICARNHRGERAYVSSFAQDAEWKLIGHWVGGLVAWFLLHPLDQWSVFFLGWWPCLFAVRLKSTKHLRSHKMK